MYIQSGGNKLACELDMPSADAPLAVILHGITGNKRERHIIGVADALREAGFGTLRVDLYGHGESEGEFRDHTLYKWVTIAMMLVDYGRNLDFVTDVYLCGHSQGGLTVMLTAAIKHDQIKALIPLSPATMIPEAARQGDVLKFRFDPKHVPEEIISEEGRVLGGNYIRVAQQIHVEDFVNHDQNA